MRTTSHPIRVLLFGGLLGLLVAGCATTVDKTVTASTDTLDSYRALPPRDAIVMFERHIVGARKAGMPLLAPDYFLEASDIALNSRKSLQDESKEDLIGDLARGDALLEKGQAIMSVVKDRFAAELAIKHWLDTFSADNSYPDEYHDCIDEFLILIKKVELGKADTISKDKEEELIRHLKALDIKSVQYAILHESDLIIQDTLKKNGEKQVPITLAAATLAYQETERLIAQTPHNSELTQASGNKALFAARHAYYVNEQVIALQNQLKTSAEDIVLEEEERLSNIANTLGQRDLRDQPIKFQAIEITRLAGEFKKSREGLQKSEQSLGSHIQDLEKRLEQTDAQLTETKALLSEATSQLTEKTAQLAEQATNLAEKDAQLSAKTTLLEENEKLLSERMAQLAEQEAQIQTLSDKVEQSKSPAITKKTASGK
ncbi:MAG: hypothetical protein HY306_13555 [Nitrosomonadales bacterium]|nr:hypothetical protein [Nitrosomonadales bacterium]